jgi:hypothetical protein
MQLNLFCNKQCDHCGQGRQSPRNSVLFDGFRDADTGQIVCWKCKEKHYIMKAKVAGTLVVKGRKYQLGEMTYSEMPVYAVNT